MDSIEFEDLQRRLKALEEENARLKALGAAVVTERQKAESALADSEERYRTLFHSIDEGFCVIEFFDGPHGPLSDYVHVEANAAYTQHAGIPTSSARSCARWCLTKPTAGSSFTAAS